MDDSVIKVLRRNGSWTNSKNVLSNEQSEKKASINSNEDFSLDKNLMFISRDVILKNKTNSLHADVIEVDIEKNDIKIFMYEENKKVSIKSLK